MENLALITLIQLALTWVMVGMLWFKQMINYPLYMKIREGFVDDERSHIRRATFLIAPIMLAEAITAVWLISLTPNGILLK